MRRFELHRDVDPTNVSGTGIVADGVVWDDGKVCLRWRGRHRSIVMWDNVNAIIAIHGHDGGTRLVWLDDEDGDGVLARC